MTVERPTYQILADELAEQITRLEPNERLPSEVELAERHNVSRLTARAAVQELERRYLVRRVKGSGTYVTRRVDYVISPRFIPWSEMVRRAGATTHRNVVSSKVVRASDEVSAGLELPTGTRVVELVRLASVNGIPANITHNYVPHDLAPGLADLLASAGDVTLALKALGFAPKRSWACSELAVPDIEIAQALDVEGRPPLWLVAHGIVDGASGRNLALSFAWNRPDVLRVRFEFGNPPIRIAGRSLSYDAGKEQHDHPEND